MDADFSMSDASSLEFFVPDMDVDGQVPPPGPSPGPAGPAGPHFQVKQQPFHSNQQHTVYSERAARDTARFERSEYFANCDRTIAVFKI